MPSIKLIVKNREIHLNEIQERISLSIGDCAPVIKPRRRTRRFNEAVFIIKGADNGTTSVTLGGEKLFLLNLLPRAFADFLI